MFTLHLNCSEHVWGSVMTRMLLWTHASFQICRYCDPSNRPDELVTCLSAASADQRVKHVFMWYLDSVSKNTMNHQCLVYPSSVTRLLYYLSGLTQDHILHFPSAAELRNLPKLFVTSLSSPWVHICSTSVQCDGRSFAHKLRRSVPNRLWRNVEHLCEWNSQPRSWNRTFR